ncbi:hypothetical protein [Silvimonas sp.]|uniref:hypothetical protein n=1 Tax=Silvimonas sp. TaxID=2650811 RepID=UPI00283D7AFD|nr:hypothetical protein [Silvimonas sp.]MDR3429569.1 hypothetical protein [Silvimonas sp.]
MNDAVHLVPLEQPLSTLPLEAPQARLSLMAGLNAPTDYWIELALSWLEDGFPVDEEIKAVLTRIVATRIYSQRTRHRAQALVAKSRPK